MSRAEILHFFLGVGKAHEPVAFKQRRAGADVFVCIERFYNPKRRHSKIGYMSPVEFERQAGLS